LKRYREFEKDCGRTRRSRPFRNSNQCIRHTCLCEKNSWHSQRAAKRKKQ
jgi:hypothetical protein